MKYSTITILLIMNILIFTLWYMTNLFNSQFMQDHFLVSYMALEKGRWWTLVTSIFSHFNLIHLMINLYVLNEFGRPLESYIGSQNIFLLYLFSGISSSLAHCLFSKFFLSLPDLSALGASGSISGILIYLALIEPRKRVYFLGLIPISLKLAVLIIILFDLRGLWGQYLGEISFIGHGAHLGGCLGGLVYALGQKKKLTLLDG
jgi:membrane associated rhomboid family serine protease